MTQIPSQMIKIALVDLRRNPRHLPPLDGLMTTYSFAADESGDVSFSFDKGASRFFVVAAVATDVPEALRRALDKVRLASHLSADFEFRLNGLSSRPLRTRLYRALADADFESWALIVDKTKLSDPFKLLSGPDFYVYFVTELVRIIPYTLRWGSTLMLDQFGSPTTARSKIRRVLHLRNIEPGFRRIQFVRSRSEPLVQVADLMVGAVMRNARGDGEVYHLIQHRFSRIDEYTE